jgi:hypothetical protein
MDFFGKLTMQLNMFFGIGIAAQLHVFFFQAKVLLDVNGQLLENLIPAFRRCFKFFD